MLVGQYQLPSIVSEDLTREDRWSCEFSSALPTHRQHRQPTDNPPTTHRHSTVIHRQPFLQSTDNPPTTHRQPSTTNRQSTHNPPTSCARRHHWGRCGSPSYDCGRPCWDHSGYNVESCFLLEECLKGAPDDFTFNSGQHERLCVCTQSFNFSASSATEPPDGPR